MLGTGVVALGLTGNAIGYLAGSLLASAFTPAQKSEGPRLSDLQVSGSAYGSPIPFILGHPRLAGQIIWASAKREIATTTSQGKGGGGSQYTSFTYEVDLLIELSDNVIAAVPRIWKDGELVSNILDTADAGTASASYASTLWSRLTVYTGGATQLPDADYEAAVGVGNAPAYRGRGTVFIKGLQLGGGGNLPNLTFEVAAAANSLPTAQQTGNNGAIVFTNGSRTWAVSITASAFYATYIRQATPRSGKKYIEYVIGTGSSGRGWFFGVVSQASWVPGYSGTPYVGDIYCITNLNYFGGVPGFVLNGGASSNAAMDVTFVAGDVIGVAVDYDAGTVIVRRNGSAFPSFTFPVGGAFDPWCSVYGASTSYNATAALAVGEATALPTGYSEYGFPVWSLQDSTLQAAVEAICARAGMPGGSYDATALASITTPVRAMTITVNSARSALETLMAAYFFTASLADKVYFTPLGTAPVLTIPYADMAWGTGGNDPEPSLGIVQGNDLEIPAQTAITYWNVDADYQTDTQYSDRLLTGQDSTSVAQMPLAFTASEAKKITDSNVAMGALRVVTTRVTLGLPYAHLQPGDVFIATDEDSSTYRLFIQQKTDSNHVLALECTLDDASVLSQAGTTSGGTASQTVVAALATTTLEPLDIPILRDADDRAGHYVAVKGDAANWTNAGVYQSLDDVTYALNTTVAEQTDIGVATTTLGAWAGGNVFDETNTLTVNVGLGQLVSATRDEVLNSISTNAALIGSELIQYRNAALVSAGVYTISGLLRGRRGTEWATDAHVASERFVALGLSGLRFLPLESSELGKLRYYKAASASQRLSDVVAKSITPMGVGLEPMSPVDARANRDTTDTVLTWRRRTRLSSRITGPLAWSHPLGEASESYEVEVWDSAYTTLKRTLTASAQTVTYTSANQVTDFGSNQTVLYLRIYQLSATVGRGYALQTSI